MAENKRHPRRSAARSQATARSCRTGCLLLLGATFAVPGRAHIGSPDTFVQAAVGPYSVLIAAHPPAVTPGALELDLRFNPDDHITAATATLDGADPTDITVVNDGTASTSLWAATPAAHALRITVQGPRGPGDYSITLPANPSPAGNSTGLRGIASVLLVLGLTLFAGAVVLMLRGSRWQGYAGLLASAGFLAAFWASHHALATTTVSATLASDGRLDLTLRNPAESFANLLPDHGKLLHLFLVREPQQDVLLHLHPQQLSPGHFSVQLPAMPPGAYQLFADFYLAGGRGETATLALGLPAQSRSAGPAGDDSFAVLPPLTRPAPPPSIDAGQALYTARMPDGYTLQLRAPAALQVLHANLLQVNLLDPQGLPPADMATYLGMAAHAVVLRSDNGVFAHIHPGGTLPMTMPSSDMVSPAPTNTATIPYGFPAPGRYRLFVQMKHGHIIETGAFDLTVS
jgi:hypothetical protein